MSARPVAVTSTDEFLGLILDELVGLRQDLADRDGASSQAAQPATGAPDEAVASKKAPAKKPAAKPKIEKVDGT